MEKSMTGYMIDNGLDSLMRKESEGRLGELECGLTSLYDQVNEGQNHFDTFLEAKKYAIENPGLIITRNKNGSGYILKGKRTREEKIRANNSSLPIRFFNV